LQQMQSNL